MKSMILLEWSVPNYSHARGDSGKEPISIVTEWRKNLGEKPAQSGGPVPLLPDKPVVCSNSSKVDCKWSTGSRVFFSPMAV